VTDKKKTIKLHVLDAFLFFIPVSLVFHYLQVHYLFTFFTTALALVGITHLMAETTSVIASRVSNTISALLNATFGNAIEFAVAFFALKNGLVELVKASITGSIILNVLFLIGVAMVAGGLRYKEQKFNKESAGLASTMLIIAVVGLALPTLYDMVVGKPAPAMHLSVSIIMGIVYLLSLLYTLGTHRHLFTVERQPPDDHHQRWSLKLAVPVLVLSTAAVALESNILVNTIEPIIMNTGISEAFIGLIFIAVLTNVPEIANAITFARRNNMTLSLEIGMSSALQIALFVVPVLVIISSAFVGGSLDLVFAPFELAAMVATAMIANYIGADGICHWVEGAQLIAVYLLIGVAFYFL